MCHIFSNGFLEIEKLFLKKDKYYIKNFPKIKLDLELGFRID